MSAVNLEDVARQIDLVLRANLGPELLLVAHEYAHKDQGYYGAIGDPVPDTPLDPPVAYFVGHQPTILERPAGAFPAIVSMCFNHVPDPSLGGDWYEAIVNTCYIEGFFVHPDESTVNRIAWRYGKALHGVLTKHPSLDGVVEAVDEPEVDVSNAFRRRTSSSDNTPLYFQGVRLDFTLIQHQQVTNRETW